MKGGLSSQDARAIVRLLGEVCALPDDHAAKKRYLMEGLCNIVDADYWLWALAAELEPGKFPVYVGFLSGRFSETEMAEFLQIQTHPDMVKWTIPLATELRTTGRHVTRNVQDQFSYDDFLASEAGQWWSRAGIEPRCIAFHPLKDGSATGVGLYRKTGRPLFTEREARIMHILLTEVPWLPASAKKPQAPHSNMPGWPALSVLKFFADFCEAPDPVMFAKSIYGTQVCVFIEGQDLQDISHRLHAAGIEF